MHLLIIEDDFDLGMALQQALKAEGFTSEWLRRIADVSNALNMADYACVLLDLTLPDGSGFDLLRRWRKQELTVPIIVMTARDGLQDRLDGLDGGADDFVVKPFAVAELISRIRAVQRRYAQQSSEIWRIGDLEIHPRRHVVQLSGEPVELSRREFQLLQELARDAGSVVAKGALSQRLEPLGDPVDFATLEVHLSNLRRKIGAERIRTLRGIGYMLVK